MQSPDIEATFGLGGRVSMPKFLYYIHLTWLPAFLRRFDLDSSSA